MRPEYDFSSAVRGAVWMAPPGVGLAELELDEDIVAWFKQQAHRQGGGNYLRLISEALTDYQKSESSVEDALRRILQKRKLH